MDLAAALDVVVARTGHARFRRLCDPDDPDYNPAYIDVVMALAGAPRDPPPTPAPAAGPPPDYLSRLPPLGGCCGGG